MQRLHFGLLVALAALSISISPVRGQSGEDPAVTSGEYGSSGGTITVKVQVSTTPDGTAVSIEYKGTKKAKAPPEDECIETKPGDSEAVLKTPVYNFGEISFRVHNGVVQFKHRGSRYWYDMDPVQATVGQLPHGVAQTSSL